MPCYKPLDAWRLPGPSGKSKIFFSQDPANSFDIRKIIHLPCGQCIGCRLERSRRWAVRLMHEAQLYERTCFLTLTYDDKNVPKNGSLNVRDFQLFMKRLRKWNDENDEKTKEKIRFFQCGEYGEKTERPHHHAIIYGCDFRDSRVAIGASHSGEPQFNSPVLTGLWAQGFATIGSVTFESAAYVARYCLKKITGRAAEEHYQGRKPEFVTMSRRPGIGAGWFEKFAAEAYPSDSVVMRGKEMMPPPFYDKLLERVDPELFKRVKRMRISESGEFYDNPDNHTRRLMDREEVKQRTAKTCLERKL